MQFWIARNRKVVSERAEPWSEEPGRQSGSSPPCAGQRLVFGISKQITALAAMTGIRDGIADAPMLTFPVMNTDITEKSDKNW